MKFEKKFFFVSPTRLAPWKTGVSSIFLTKTCFWPKGPKRLIWQKVCHYIFCSLWVYEHFIAQTFLFYRVTLKKHANWIFLREIIQLNLPKFAYNLFRGRRVRIWSPILGISIPSVPESRSKFSKNGKKRFVQFYDQKTYFEFNLFLFQK